MQSMFHSFEKNAKERENIAFFWKERMPNPAINYWVLWTLTISSLAKL